MSSAAEIEQGRTSGAETYGVEAYVSPDYARAERDRL